jgi:hypothetical protein
LETELASIATEWRLANPIVTYFVQMLGANGEDKTVAVYGYARVSTKDQNLDAQLEALKAAGCSRLFQEKISGKTREGRPALEKALNTLGEGDVLVVSRLDRLARSSRDLLNIIKQITDAGASFRRKPGLTPRQRKVG